jgi:hypothetical protein
MEDDGHEVWAEARKTSTVESDVEDELGGVWCGGRDGRTGHPIFFLKWRSRLDEPKHYRYNLATTLATVNK